MNKLPFVLILVVFIFAGAALMFGTPSDTENTGENGTEKLQVAATIFPLYDIVREVAGDAADVTLVVVPGVSPHTFEMAPAKLAELASASAVFAIGELDEWIDGFVPEGAQRYHADENIELVPFREIGHQEHEGEEHEGEMHEDEEMHEEDHVDEQESEDGHDDDGDMHDEKEDAHGHDHDGDDPHYWLDARNAKLIAEFVYETMAELDPTNAEAYATNYGRYAEALDELDEEIRTLLSNASSTELITFHDSWQYFENAYGLETVAVVESQPGVEPLPEDVQEVYEAVEEHGITAIFSEPQLSSEQVAAFTQDLGLTEYVIDPLGGLNGRESYIDMMRYNATTFAQALSQ
jgi:zinc transport system substrate-binding protein